MQYCSIHTAVVYTSVAIMSVHTFLPQASLDKILVMEMLRFPGHQISWASD